MSGAFAFLAASAYAKPSEEDREHMNEEGHAALAEAVYAKLKEMLAGEKENAQIPGIDESGRERGQKRNLTAVCLTGLRKRDERKRAAGMEG